MNSQRGTSQTLNLAKQLSSNSGIASTKHNRSEWQKTSSNNRSNIPTQNKSSEKTVKKSNPASQNQFLFNTSQSSSNSSSTKLQENLNQMQGKSSSLVSSNTEIYQTLEQQTSKATLSVESANKNDTSKIKNKPKNKVLIELQNHLVNFNSQKNSFSSKNKQDLIYTISQFQSSTKAQKEIKNNALTIENRQEDIKSDEFERKSPDSEIDTEDVNESCIVKRSCSLPKITDSTPKSLTLLSNNSNIKPKELFSINSGRESRNQLQHPFMSQQNNLKLESNEKPCITIEQLETMDVASFPQSSKTPQDVFSYKIKPQAKQKLKSGCNILNRKNKNSKKNSQNDQKVIVKAKLPQFFNLQKSESQESMLHIAAKELETMNQPFLYNTLSIPPPNSVNNISQNQQSKDQFKSQIVHFDCEEDLNMNSNIKVVARFRPFNNIENELVLVQEKNNDEIVHFYEDLKTLKIKEDFYSLSNNLTFTFDHVFQSNATQEQIFNYVGKETISDIMNGYNGTIFAYGQTGSGKTFSMYGLDIFDEQLMGIIPRAARQIFNMIREQDLEIEYQIRIQMVEIYKETLRDLLHDLPEQPAELKIKEDPKRGTYVEGLTEVCIVNEEEIMTVLCTGETMRQVASTHLNQVSSRSHSICIIEIVQKYPNDSEKRGILNLVDLAGSERVSKSHAQGKALEEAKKINFSLSMLGKVINCLTKNASHIPYRDSKLTRLLKESLGGNNKTTLLVACSMHQSNIDETISTLRFAQSAKFIQNKVKMNIKTSPEQLQLEIEQLKQELRYAKQEIYRLITNSSNGNSSIKKQEIEYKQDDFLYKTCDPTNQNARQQLHNRPHQSLSSKNYDVIETNNQKIQLYLPQDLSIIPISGTPNFISPVKNYELKLSQLIRRNEDLEMRLKSKDLDFETQKQQKIEIQEKCQKLEDKIINYKQKMLILEKRVAEFESDKDNMIINEVKYERKINDSKSQIEVLTSQVKCLEKALWESEQNCQELLTQKQHMQQKSFKDFLNETIKLTQINVSAALENFIKTDSQSLKKSFISQLDLEKDLENQLSLQNQNKFEISLLDQDLLKHNIYSLELVNAIEESDVRPEITIYLLKQLLMDAALANHNLQRVLAINRWRQTIEFGKHKIKSELCKIQENTIETLEQILEKSRVTHDKLRGRVDKLENHLYDNRNYYNDIVLLTEGALYQNPTVIFSSSKEQNINNKIQILSAINRNHANTSQVNQIQCNQSQSIVTNKQSVGNQKPRFVRTITNKNLGKGFQLMERSPHSKASLLGGANVSILSQIYGQTNKNITPIRTCGINSPIIKHFQSPLRRQNTFIIPRATQPQIISQQVNAQPQTVTNKQNFFQYEDAHKEGLAFEDALHKFFNMNENNNEKEEIIEEKKQTTPIIDMEKVESMESVEEIKEYLRLKMGRQQDQDKSNLPMIAQYQNACHTNTQQQQQNQSNQNQINNNTTNNNALYAFSNDYDNMAPSLTQNLPSNNSANENQRQEHVLTMASEYLMTSNSVIGLAGLYNNVHGSNQYHQNEYLDRLQEKIVQLQEEVDTQKCRAEEHKKAYYESKRQIEQMRQLMEDNESKQNIIMKNEIYQWENAVNKLKEMNEMELQRKQKEIQKLHELLAQWIDNYQELEINRGFKPNEIEKLLLETLEHKRNKSNTDTLKTQSSTCQTHVQAILNQYYNINRKLSTYTAQNELNKSNKTNQILGFSGINGTYENYSLETHTLDNQNIKGDNSPITQDDSCLELESSQRQESRLDLRESIHRMECL